MEKRGQLAMLEFRFAIIGFLIGLVGGLALIFIGEKNIIPFKIPLVCGPVLLNKKGQLGVIEFKYFIVGFFVGLILAFGLVWLGSSGILPFKIPFICG